MRVGPLGLENEDSGYVSLSGIDLIYARYDVAQHRLPSFMKMLNRPEQASRRLKRSTSQAVKLELADAMRADALASPAYLPGLLSNHRE